jgi:N-methylhydantoinase B
MEVGAREGHEFDISAMLDRVHHPALGRRGGGPGAATTIAQDDGKQMHGKGKQFVPHGRRVQMAFPGGAGYGDPADRDPAQVARDLALGYITPDFAAEHYGLTGDVIADILRRAKQGEVF